MRHLALLALPALLGACAGGGDDSRSHGPVYYDGGSDGGPDAATDATPDRAGDAPRDAAGDSPVDGGADSSTPLEAGDSSIDSAADSAETGSDGSTCTSVLAILGGNATTAFGATSVGGASWAVNPLTGNTATVPALVAMPGGFEGAFQEAGNVLAFSTYGGGAWSPPAPIGAALTPTTPALAVLGASVHLVYLGTNHLFYHGTFSAADGGAGAWDNANDPVGVADGGAQAFGQSGPGAASAGSSFVMVQDGNDGLLYDEPWSGAWQAANAHSSAMVTTVPPAAVALSGGGSDLLVIFNHAGDFTLYSTVRSAGSGTWSAPVRVDMNAFTNDPVALAPLPGGGAVMVYRGTNQQPYFSLYDPTAAAPWTAPASLVTPAPTLSSPPTVAAGVCGADAVAAYAPSAGGSEVEVVSLHGGTWSAPSQVSGTAGMTTAAIATSP